MWDSDIRTCWWRPFSLHNFFGDSLLNWTSAPWKDSPTDMSKVGRDEHNKKYISEIYILVFNIYKIVFMFLSHLTRAVSPAREFYVLTCCAFFSAFCLDLAAWQNNSINECLRISDLSDGQELPVWTHQQMVEMDGQDKGSKEMLNNIDIIINYFIRYHLCLRAGACNQVNTNILDIIQIFEIS